MKTQTKQNKIIAIMSAVILLLVALSATLTFAYFTANSSASNSQMTFGTLVIDIGDQTTGINAVKADSDTCSAGLSNITPGCSVTLSGKAVVNTNIYSFVRVAFDIKANVTDGNSTSTDLLTTETNGAVLKAQLMATIFGASNDTENELGKIFDGSTWVYYDDNDSDSVAGYYYYNTAVINSGNTKALTVFDFGASGTTITFDSRLYGDVWQGANIVITLSIQAIQAEHLKKAGNAGDVELTTGNQGINEVTIESNIVENAETGNVKELATAEAWTVADSTSKGVVTTNP